MTTAETNESQGGAATQDALLDIRGLKMYFPVTAGVFRRKVGDVKAVDDVNLTVQRGETLAVVGESGSGKTTLGRAILRLYKPTAGEVWFDGTDLAQLSAGRLKPYKQQMQIIFQDPYSSLNPRLSAGSIVGEPLQVHNLTASRGEYRDRVAQLFSTVGLNPRMVSRYPHEFSGGQRQRIGIARALAMQPEFIVADEPVSALDVSVQAQVLNLLEDLQDQFNLTYMLVAHDLSVVRHTADRVVVMYLGKIVELANVVDLFDNPIHPLHQGTDVGCAYTGPHHRGYASAAGTGRRHPKSGEPSVWVRVPHSVPYRHRRLSWGRPRAARDNPDALGGLHPGLAPVLPYVEFNKVNLCGRRRSVGGVAHRDNSTLETALFLRASRALASRAWARWWSLRRHLAAAGPRDDGERHV